LKTQYVGQSYEHKINLICNILKKKKIKKFINYRARKCGLVTKYQR